MQVHDPARDGEAQTGAAGLARAGLIGAVEALENVRQVFFADADATIADFNSGASRPVSNGHGDPATGWSVLDCVVENDEEKAVDRGGIGGDSHGTSSNFSGDFDSLAGG